MISVLASFVFASQEISVGSSSTLFSLVGAYSACILVHRQALRSHGITALGWLILVIGMNLGLGFVIPSSLSERSKHSPTRSGDMLDVDG